MPRPPKKEQELYAFLAQYGPEDAIPAATVRAFASQAGLSDRTIARAKKKSQYSSVHRGDQWYWVPPNHTPEGSRPLTDIL